MEMRQYTVYMLTNKYNTVIYIGVTSDIQNRTLQHKQKAYPGFTKTYACDKLVYIEHHQWMDTAITREKQLKAGSRQKKVDLIIKENPDWNDLSAGWFD